MDKETRTWLKILSFKVDALGVRVGAIEAARAMKHKANQGFVVKVVHVPKEKT